LSGFVITNVIGVTNVLFQTNVTDSFGTRPVQIAEVSTFTSLTFGVFPLVVQPAPSSVLRGGIGKIRLERLTNAVFTGTNFLHTNTYTASYITNIFGIPSTITNTFFSVNQSPDILFGAGDLGLIQEVPVLILRVHSPGFVSNAGLNSALPNQGGPGNIFGPITVSYSKVGPGLFNQRPGVATEEAGLQGFGESFIWGSFDGSTNPPVVFPKDITLEDIELLINGGLAP
jgi:hypothetical protein